MHHTQAALRPHCTRMHSKRSCLINKAVTVASGIDVGQGMNVRPGKFGINNKYRALNAHVLFSK